MAEYLVTGGTSFIASHVINALLQYGHYVRTTVRNSDEEKVKFLWELKGAKERLKIFEADLTVEGSFDEAVNGVDGVFHIASRFSVIQDDNNREKLLFTQVFPINESHWSDLDYCKRFKLWYGYAKTLVEKEAWKIAAEKKLNLVVVISSFTIGPILVRKPQAPL